MKYFICVRPIENYKILFREIKGKLNKKRAKTSLCIERLNIVKMSLLILDSTQFHSKSKNMFLKKLTNLTLKPL